MRNLVLLRNVKRTFAEISDVDCFCTDPQETYSGFVLSKNIVYKLTYDDNLETVYDLNEYFVSGTVPEIVHMSCNSIINSICFAFCNGDIVTIDLVSKELQCVGSVESGLKTAEWSPDQEVIILVTGKDSIIVMSLSFDPIAEVELHQKDFGEKQFITVGWGKKETQFHGSEGKAAAHKNEKSVTKISHMDDSKPRISWRGDGSYFVVNTVNPETLSRHLRVFSRDGILQYTSEHISGLEEPIAWRPSGSIIATSQRLPNKHTIAFYEKNGLQHGGFTLPFEPEECKVQELSWNTESTILAIWCENYSSRNAILQLWTVNNYHWYLKHSLQFPSGNELLALEWNAIQGCRLHVLSKGTHYETYDWKWSVHHSFDASKNDGATVAVIDGRKVLITSFRKSIVPPPLCSQSLELSAPVNDVMFAPSTISKQLPEAFSVIDANSLCVIMDDSNASIFVRSSTSLCYEKWLSFNIEHEIDGKLHHWLWLRVNEFIVCCSTASGNTRVLLMHLDVNENKLFVRSETSVEGNIMLILQVPNRSSQAVIQLDTGVILLIEAADMSICPFASPLPEPCYDLQICHVNNRDVTFALSSRNRLYMDGKEVANNVTSMAMHSEFLLLTTLRHVLLCVRLDAAGLQKLAAGEVGSGRQVERGARLVLTIPYDTRVILQMPRGNLECIQPRPLTLHVAAAQLGAGNYKDAFLLFRKQRINLNLLCDLQPEKFLSQVDQFIKQLLDPNWLSLFLSELQEENVIHTMYAEHFTEKPAAIPNKVRTVCMAAREAMLRQPNAEELLFPILTSHVKEGTDSDLSEALFRVKALKEQGKAGVDEALRHLLYLEDVNRLYNIALGLYDFDLVMLVAAKSNKDPKEYVAFLNELRRMQPEYRHFVIDKHLKRYHSALQHISLCSEEEHFDECLAFVKNHNLYSKALQLFPKGSDRYQKIAAAFADHLKEKMSYQEAGTMYVRAGRHYDALLAFQRAGDWREALHMADKLQYKENQLHVLCQELVTGQIGRRNFIDAAQILREYLKDIERSVKVLVQGRKWNEAMWVCLYYKQDEYLDKIIKPAMEEHLDQLTGQLTSIHEQFETYKARLNAVRVNKQKSLLEEKEDVKEESDLYSDTSSIITASNTGSRYSSTRSSRSSKNKRKQERKLLSLKEGSPFEDLALIRALHQLITETHDLTEEVQILCKMLLRFDKDEDAMKLQVLLIKLLEEMEKSKEEIWTPDLQQTTKEFGPDATVNSITSNFQMQQSMNVGLSLLEPQLRFPPLTKLDKSWQFSILS